MHCEVLQSDRANVAIGGQNEASCDVKLYRITLESKTYLVEQ